MNRPESPSNDAFVSPVSLVSRLVSAVLALALGLLGLVLAFVLVPLPLPVGAPSTRTNFLSMSPLSVTTDHSSPGPGTTPGGATPGLPSPYLERPRASSPSRTTRDVIEVPWFWMVEE
jgi:hypothetical protein